ncbi:MAG: transcriptional regulator, ArsR family [Candidatus Eremiobacteraeota bacterium]|nr:transcriptional regulator, ArsR family [Candidatus Eremiobacteraeota bacterium]
MPTPRCLPVTEVDPRDFTTQADLLRAVADPYRLKILATIAAAGQPVCVCDLTEGLPIGQSSVSHHLAILREAGIVTSDRRGTWAYYSIAPALPARLLAAIGAVLPEVTELASAAPRAVDRLRSC